MTIFYDFNLSSLNFYLIYLVLFFSILWFINLYNFMDGSDGLVIAHTILIITSLMIFACIYNYDNFNNYYYLLYTIAILFGFAIMNFPPAKIFMGDSGSIFLGFLNIFLCFYFVEIKVINISIFLILNSFFILDTSIAIIQKIIKGINLLTSHKSHLYQILIESYSKRMTREQIARRRNHLNFLLKYIFLYIFILMPCALLSFIYYEFSYYITLILYIIFISIIVYSKNVLQINK